MKLIIDIPKKTYNEIKERTIVTCGEIFAKNLVRRIRNGKPLPEHHGRLIDADAIPRHLVREMDEIDKQPTIIEGSDSE